MNRKMAFACLLFIALLFSCSKDPQTQSNAVQGIASDLVGKSIKLDSMILAKPGKVVSSQATLDVEFQRAMVPDFFIQGELNADAWVMKPHVDGKAVWLTPSLLRFQPQSPLPPGEKFSVILRGKETFGSTVQTNDLEFSFQVVPQELLQWDGAFEPVDGKQNTARLNALLQFSQKVDSAKLHKDLLLGTQGHKLGFQLQFGGKRNVVRLLSQEVLRTETERTFTLELSKDWSVNEEKLQQDFLLPSAGEFVVLGAGAVSVAESDQKAWGIRFSDAIADGQDWSAFVTVTPQIPIKVKVFGRVLRIQGRFESGIPYNVRILENLPSSYGVRLQTAWDSVLYFENEKPRVEWISEGSIVPLENRGKIQFRAMNISRALLRVYEVPLQNQIFFLQNNRLDKSTILADEYDYGYGYNDLERVAEPLTVDTLRFQTASKNKWHSVELDFNRYLKSQKGSAYIAQLVFDQEDLLESCSAGEQDASEGLYYADDSWAGNPCESGYYYENGTVEKAFLSTSVGITAKKSSQGVHVWTTDVAFAKPLGGVLLKSYSYRNVLLESQRTDGSGHASFRKGNPYVILGEHNRGPVLLRLDGTTWETSRFETGGDEVDSSGLRAFLYTERGVYRPGDSIWIGAIFRSGNVAPKAGMPLVLGMVNARGQNTFEAKGTTNSQGMALFAIPTQLSDPTGTWSALVQVGGSSFRIPVRVETVKPNRMKVQTSLPTQFRKQSGSVSTQIQARYLFGLAASNNRVVVQSHFQRAQKTFPRYARFRFAHPFWQFAGEVNDVYDGELNSDGQIDLSIPVTTAIGTAPALDMTLQVRVFEQGGEWTEHWQGMRVEPYPVWVGLDTAIAGQWVRRGDSLHIPYVALDANGKAVAGRKLRIRVYGNSSYWWWNYQENGETDFRTMEHTFLLNEWQVRSASKAIPFHWVPEEEGRVLFEITDMEGGHSSAIEFQVSDWGNKSAGRHADKSASWLDLQFNRNGFQPGDSIQVAFTSPSGSQALVGIEQAGRVLESRWIQTTSPRTIVKLPIRAEMVPNAYVSVSLQQPNVQRPSDRPLRTYGIKSFQVEDKNSRLNMELQAPAELKPDEKFQVLVRNRSNQTTSYTLAIVDEGLLDLTRFQTPNPWKFFYRKLAHGFTMIDNLDEVVGALLPHVDALFKLGGDESQSGGNRNPKGRRFPLVSLQSGLRTMGAQGQDKLEFRMPHYVGSVRMMLIASSSQGLTHLEKTVPVRKPLVMLPSLPRIARPSDELSFPVAIFAMNDKIRQVSVKMVQLEGAELIGDGIRFVQFKGPGEEEAQFLIKVKENAQKVKVTVKAEGSGFVATESVELPVEAISPPMTFVHDTIVNAMTSVHFEPGSELIEGTGHYTLEVAQEPHLPLSAMQQALQAYPYGCLEQTTSGAMPWLWLMKDDKGRVQKGIERLHNFQNGAGGFSTWPQSNWQDSWATSWAGHFMLEARAKGFAVPNTLFEHWRRFELQQASKSPSKDLRSQAYRLYLLAKAGTPAIPAMNLLRESYGSQLDALSAGLLAYAYQKQGQQDVARQVLARANQQFVSERELSGTYGSPLRDLALLTAVTMERGDKTQALRYMNTLVRQWRYTPWHSTQELGMALLAHAKIGSRDESITDLELEITEEGKETKIYKVKKNGERISIHNAVSIKAKKSCFLRFEATGMPKLEYLGELQKGVSLQRVMRSEQGEILSFEQMPRGNPVWVQYFVSSSVPIRLDGMALQSLFPAGFEIVNPRLREEMPQWLVQESQMQDFYMDLRDDRVNWFFSLEPYGKAIFSIQVIPTYSGKFIVPAVTLETMYSPDFVARLAPLQMEL